MASPTWWTLVLVDVLELIWSFVECLDFLCSRVCSQEEVYLLNQGPFATGHWHFSSSCPIVSWTYRLAGIVCVSLGAIDLGGACVMHFHCTCVSFWPWSSGPYIICCFNIVGWAWCVYRIVRRPSDSGGAFAGIVCCKQCLNACLQAISQWRLCCCVRVVFVYLVCMYVCLHWFMFLLCLDDVYM